MRRAQVVRLGLWTAAALAAPTVLAAQRDSTTVQVQRALRDELERVARTLLEKRQTQIDLSNQVRRITIELRSAPSVEARSQAEQSLLRLRDRLRVTAR